MGANPVIGTAPCIDCGGQLSVHQVSKGKGNRLMFYTRCSDCGCDQRTGKKIQEYYFNNTTPRPGFEHCFDGQKPPGIERQEAENISEVTDESPVTEEGASPGQKKSEPQQGGDTEAKKSDKCQHPVKTRSKTPLIIGLTVLSIAGAIMGIK